MKGQRLKKARGFIVNVLATTALSVLLMSGIAAISGYRLSGITIPFEMLLVNFLMHFGFFALGKVDLKYSILHYGILLAYVVGLIIGFGFLFRWFEVIAVWIICAVGVAVYFLSITIDALKWKRDAAEINDKLKRIKRTQEETKGEKEI